VNPSANSARSTLVGLGLAAMLLGAALSADAQPLALEDALARGLATSRVLEIEAARTAAAKAHVDYMDRQYFPSLVGSGSYTRSSEVAGGAINVNLPAPIGPQNISLPSGPQDAWLFRLGLQQPLFTGYRIEAGIGQARAALAAANADAAARRRETASSIERAWWGLVLAQESYRVVSESAASIRAHVGEAQKRLDRGLGLRTELLAARMRVDDLEALISDASSALSLARAKLNLLMGLSWDVATEALVPAELEGPAALPPMAGLVEKARSSRPELASAAARIASAEASLRLANSALLPNVFLTGSLAYADPNPKAFPPRSGFEPLWDVGLLVSLDLGRIPSALSQAEEARANAGQARLALAQAGDSVTMDVVSAWLELSKDTDRLRATASSVGLAEDALRSSRDRFDAGLALSTEVSDAETALLRSKLDRTRSRVAWELARADLRDALGGE
jgi:outer membrane protein